MRNSIIARTSKANLTPHPTRPSAPPRHATCGLLTVVALLLPLAAGAAAGDLDPLDAAIVGGDVRATALQPDGKLIIAGSFTSVLGVARTNIGRLNADGTLDPVFNPNATGPTLGGAVNCVAVQADGKVLVGGYFTRLQPNGAPSPAPRACARPATTRSAPRSPRTTPA